MIERPRPQKCTAVVLSKEKVSSKVYLVMFKLKQPESLTFLAGQNIMWHIAPGVNRSMSIATPPSESTRFMMAHDITPMGPGSQMTLTLKVGDEMSFMGPLGVFYLDTESARKKVFVATGTGVAPFRSMLLEYLHHGGTDDVTLYWGLRHEEDIFWDEEFTELSRKYPNFRYILTLSQPTGGEPAVNVGASQAGTPWRRGRVTDHVFTDEVHMPRADFYLCGNKPMITDMEEKLAEAGVPKEQVKKELFF